MADGTLSIAAWQVVWPYDPSVTPPKPKIWACLAPSRGLFTRINSDPSSLRPFAIPLPAVLHPFLQHDSWLNCGQAFQCDEHRLTVLLAQQQCPARSGILGEIHESLRDLVRDEIARATTLSDELKYTILSELR